MSCGQENTRVHKCVIYADQNFADFSLLYLKNDRADFYEIYIFYALHIHDLSYEIWKKSRQQFARYSFSKVVWFSSYSFFLLRTKPEIISSLAKTIFSCFDFLQIWYTYRAIKDLRIQRFSWNSMPIRKSYTQFSLDFFQNFLSRLPNRPLTLSIWNFYQAFKYY